MRVPGLGSLVSGPWVWVAGHRAQPSGGHADLVALSEVDALYAEKVAPPAAVLLD